VAPHNACGMCSGCIHAERRHLSGSVQAADAKIGDLEQIRTRNIGWCTITKEVRESFQNKLYRSTGVALHLNRIFRTFGTC
jgi:hypothetical protein